MGSSSVVLDMSKIHPEYPGSDPCEPVSAEVLLRQEPEDDEEEDEEDEGDSNDDQDDDDNEDDGYSE